MNQVHIVPDGESWSVKKDGDDVVLHSASTQEEAQEWARNYAQENGMELATHAESGEIREKDSSGEGVDDPDSPDNT